MQARIENRTLINPQNTDFCFLQPDNSATQHQFRKIVLTCISGLDGLGKSAEGEGLKVKER